MDYLSQSENTKVLEELDIGTDSKNPELNDDALIRLICAKYLSKLRVLNIAGQNFTEGMRPCIGSSKNGKALACANHAFH